MQNIPECLQPAVEQIVKYESKIAVLESEKQGLGDDIQVLSDERAALQKQIEDEAAAHANAVENYEKEKLTLRELNLVVRDQLREKSEELELLTAAQSEFQAQNGQFHGLNNSSSEQNTDAGPESLRINADQEALIHHTASLKEAIEKLRIENSALKEENSALTLVNSAMHQRQAQPQNDAKADNTELLAEIQKLKNELNIYKSDNSDVSFLQGENARLVQRHGEITQEKMQASAKMHAAQKELIQTSERLDATLKTLEQLEFQYQGLQNLYNNLTEERDTLIADNGSLVNAKAELQEKSQHLGELIQRVTNEKELIVQELSQEHIKADAMAEEINHLRLKSRTLAEEIKLLKENALKEPRSFEPEVQALEIDMSQTEEKRYEDEVEIVTPLTNSGPHYPGEFHNDDVK